jgi:hypothetical protein
MFHKLKNNNALVHIALAAFAFGVPTIVALAALVPCDGPTCQACDLVKMGQTILTWIIGIMATIIAIVIVVAGLKMVTSGGNVSKVSEARGMMTNAIVGFIILLSGWLIVDTFMKMFVKDSIPGFGPWNEISCVAQPVVTPPPVVVAPAPAGTYTDADARAALAAAGITVNKTEAEGTSLTGIRYATIQDAIDLKTACGCEIVITGGTEGTGGHAGGTFSHENGYKYDVRLSPAVDSYITTNYTYSGVRSDGAKLYVNPTTRNVYALEGDHWDVLVKGTQGD